MRASACTAQCMHLREVWVRNAFVLARACNWVAGSTTSAKAARAAVLIRAAFVAISPIAPLPFPDSQYAAARDSFFFFDSFSFLYSVNLDSSTKKRFRWEPDAALQDPLIFFLFCFFGPIVFSTGWKVARRVTRNVAFLFSFAQARALIPGDLKIHVHRVSVKINRLQERVSV